MLRTDQVLIPNSNSTKPKAKAIQKIPHLANIALQKLIKEREKHFAIPFSDASKAEQAIEHLKHVLEKKDLADKEIVTAFRAQTDLLKMTVYLSPINQFINESSVLFYKLPNVILKAIAVYLNGLELIKASAVSLHFHTIFTEQTHKKLGTPKDYSLHSCECRAIQTNVAIPEAITVVQSIKNAWMLGTQTGMIYVTHETHTKNATKPNATDCHAQDSFRQSVKDSKDSVKQSIKDSKDSIQNSQLKDNHRKDHPVLTMHEPEDKDNFNVTIYCKLQAHTKSIMNMILAPNESYWVSHSVDHQFCIWSIDNTLLSKIKFHHTSSSPFPYSSALLNNGDIVFLQSNDIQIHSYDASAKKIELKHHITRCLSPTNIFALNHQPGYVVEDRLENVDSNSTTYIIGYDHRNKEILNNGIIACCPLTLMANDLCIFYVMKNLAYSGDLFSYTKELNILHPNTKKSWGLKDILSDNFLALPYGYFMTKGKPSENIFQLAIYRVEDRIQAKKSKEKYQPRFIEDILMNAKNASLFLMQDGNVLIRAENKMPHIMFFPPKKAIIPIERASLFASEVTAAAGRNEP